MPCSFSATNSNCRSKARGDQSHTKLHAGGGGQNGEGWAKGWRAGAAGGWVWVGVWVGGRRCGGGWGEKCERAVPVATTRYGRSSTSFGSSPAKRKAPVQTQLEHTLARPARRRKAQCAAEELDGAAAHRQAHQVAGLHRRQVVHLREAQGTSQKNGHAPKGRGRWQQG